MRAKLAQQTLRPQPHALVLGKGAVASRIADELQTEGFIPVCVGEADQEIPPLADPQAASDLEALIKRFLAEAGAAPTAFFHCVHPAASAWADRPELSLIGQRLGVHVLAPPPRVISLFSNRLNLLHEAGKLGIPHLVLSFEPIQTVREVERLIDSLEFGKRSAFPFVLKSAMGVGGGLGIRVIESGEDLKRELPIWQEQLRRKLGETILYAERYLDGARYIVAPFARFSGGHTEFFPMVDASLKSRHRKLVEFCPAIEVDRAAERQMRTAVRQIAESTGFVGLGALEFMVAGKRAYLVEGLARLNTGFHIWEKVAGTRAVPWQLATLTERNPDESLTQETEKKSAILLRLYAEDTLLRLPTPGKILEDPSQSFWRTPQAQGWWDSGFRKGDEVPIDSDGMIGLLTVSSRDRIHGIEFAKQILKELWISGSLQTNGRFIWELLSNPWVGQGVFHAGFVEEEFIPQMRPTSDLVRVFVGLCRVLQEKIGGSHDWMLGTQWVKKPDLDPVNWAKGPEFFEVDGLVGVTGKVEIHKGVLERVCAYPVGGGRWQVRVGLWNRVLRQVERGGGLKLFSQTSGRVHSLLYREGGWVPAQEPALVVESMQYLVPHVMPIEVQIKEWKVRAEDQVKYGQVLAHLKRREPKND